MPPAPPGPNEPPDPFEPGDDGWDPSAAEPLDEEQLALAFRFPPLFPRRPPVDPSTPAPTGPDLSGLQDAFKNLMRIVMPFFPQGSPFVAMLLPILQGLFGATASAATKAAADAGNMEP